MSADTVLFAVGLLGGVLSLICALALVLVAYCRIYAAVARRRAASETNAADDEWLARINVAPLSSAVSERTIVARRETSS